MSDFLYMYVKLWLIKFLSITWLHLEIAITIFGRKKKAVFHYIQETQSDRMNQQPQTLYKTWEGRERRLLLITCPQHKGGFLQQEQRWDKQTYESWSKCRVRERITVILMDWRLKKKRDECSSIFAHLGLALKRVCVVCPIPRAYTCEPAQAHR